MKPPSTAPTSPAVTALWLWLGLGAAATTIWTHLAQMLAISFRVHAVVTTALLVMAALRAGRAALRARSTPMPAGTVPLLAGCVVLGGLLALLSHRPDLDDVNYVPNLVHFLAHPDAPLDFAVHYVVGENGHLPTSLFQSTALPYEFAQAAVSWTLGIPLLAGRYFVFPALAGLLLPLAWFYALRCLGLRTRGAALGGAVLLCGLLLLGDTFRSYGTYAFVRLHMAKTVFMALGLPIFVGASIEFLRQPSRTGWLLLFALATASVGLTGSAIPILAIQALLLCGAHALAALPARPPLLRGIAYGSCLAYLVAYAATVLAHARRQLSSDSALNQDWPADFGGHWDLMFKADPPASLIAMVAGIAAALVLTRGYWRRLLAAWTALAAVFVLNPVMGPLLIEHVTSSNIYWRLFYTLPFPIAGGIAAGVILDGDWLAGRRRWLAFLTIVLVITGLHWAPRTPSVYRSKRSISSLGPPRYNVDLANFAAAEQVAAVAPDGPMLAPLRIAAFLPMVRADVPQLTTRESELLMWVTGLGAGIEVAELRKLAGDFVGAYGGTVGHLTTVLQRYPLRSVVIEPAVYTMTEVATTLREAGFDAPQEVAGYLLLTRG